jgi:hypothetical protein
MTGYRFWLWTAVVLLALTTLIHGTSLFLSPAPQNDTERQLMELMTTYRIDFGAGFKRSTRELFTALSACFSLVCLFGALTLGYLARKPMELGVLKGVIGISTLVFGICFAIMLVFTFLPPIILTGLIFLSLFASYMLIGSVVRPSS